MAKERKPKKESKVVGVQEDGTEVYGFDSEPVQDMTPQRVLPKGAIKNHAKFDKFKKGNN